MENIYDFRNFFLKEREPAFFGKEDSFLVNALLSFPKQEESEADILKYFIKNINNFSAKALWYVLGILYITNEIKAMGNAYYFMFNNFDQQNKAYSMSKTERIFYDSLPDIIQAYRVHPKEEGDNWMSLTLSVDVAKTFCELYSRDEISVYEVKKENVFLYFNKRKEEEIIVLENKQIKRTGTIFL